MLAPRSGHFASFLAFFCAFLTSAAFWSLSSLRRATMGQLLHGGCEWQHFFLTLMVPLPTVLLSGAGDGG